MFLSKLTLNTRLREVRRDLGSVYEMHRTLLRAFPGQDEGGPGRVLFRVEPQGDDVIAVVLVQSEKRPDWARFPAGYARVEGPKALQWAFSPGNQMVFRLRANPTVKREGKRLGLFREEDQHKWLERKAVENGFSIVCFQPSRDTRVYARKVSGDEAVVQTHQSVDFEGVLQVTDAERFKQAVCQGIGSGKAFGFGLLSVARVGGGI